jgi:luciferase family oxidoreductase group 1
LGAEEFPRHLLDLMGLLGDRRTAHGLWDKFSATPVLESTPQIVLLGSSDYSAQLAGQLGLPFAFAHHFDTGGTLIALERYHQNFEPSPILQKPYTIVTASVLTAESEERAEWFAAPGRLMRYGIRSGRFLPLMPPEAAAEHPDLDMALRMPTQAIVGTPESAVEQLEGLAEQTAANELMIASFTHGIEERVRSLELLAAAWRS